MTMHILVADDEAPARERLRRLVVETGAGEVVGEAATGSEVLAGVKAHGPDLVLLDIRMPDGDGIATARALADTDPPPAVVFVTALADRALAALEAGATAYLVKPVTRERLAAAIARAERPTRAQLAALEDEGAPRTHFAARVGREVRLIPVSEVLYFRAEDKTTLAILASGEVTLDVSLDALGREFPERFVRIRRNLLVARDAITCFTRENTNAWVEIANGERLAVARRLRHALAATLAGAH